MALSWLTIASPGRDTDRGESVCAGVIKWRQCPLMDFRLGKMFIFVEISIEGIQQDVK